MNFPVDGVSGKHSSRPAVVGRSGRCGFESRPTGSLWVELLGELRRLVRRIRRRRRALWWIEGLGPDPRPGEKRTYARICAQTAELDKRRRFVRTLMKQLVRNERNPNANAAPNPSR